MCIISIVDLITLCVELYLQISLSGTTLSQGTRVVAGPGLIGSKGSTLVGTLRDDATWGSKSAEVDWDDGSVSYSVKWGVPGAVDGTALFDVWDASSSSVLLTFTEHSDTVRSVAWAPDGSKIASGSYDTTVMVGTQFLCNLHVFPAFYRQNSTHSGVGRLIRQCAPPVYWTF